MPHNLEELKIAAGDVLLESLKSLLQGSVEDLSMMTEELGMDLLDAAAEGDDQLFEITVARLKLLGERYRIKANAAAWEIAQSIAKALFAFAKEALLP